MNKNKNQTQLNITHGNDISLLVTLMRDGELFPTHLAQDVKVSILSRMGYRQNLNFQLDVDKLLIDIPAKIVMTNVYGLLIEGTLGNSQWRTFYESLLRYTDFTEAMLTDSVQQRGDSFDLTMDVQLYKGIDEVKMDERISEHNEDEEAHAEAFAAHNSDEEAHRAQFAAMKRLIDLEKVLPVTYESLMQLRDEERLLPGQWYRITDYVTTTTQADTQSADHPFDILVMASKPDLLLETAFAAVHEGDTYFQSSKLEAWELNYCLDNDTDRFAWADPLNGKGVVYRLKDEWANDLPYDFKNIMFKRCYAEPDQFDGKGAYIAIPGLTVGKDDELLPAQDDDDFVYLFTFSCLASLDEDTAVHPAQADASMGFFQSGDELSAEYDDSPCPTGNVFEAHFISLSIDDEPLKRVMALPNITFGQFYKDSASYRTIANRFGANCHDLSLVGKDFHDNLLQSVSESYFFYGCFHSTFQKANRSSFGNVNYSSFGNVQFSSFGNVNYSSFGDVESSSFGDVDTCSFVYVKNCSFGDVWSSSFGEYVQFSSFGNVQFSSFGYVRNSSFGDVDTCSFVYVKNCSFGYVRNSSFGDVESSSFGDVGNSSFGYVRNSSFGNCAYIVSRSYIRNLRVVSGSSADVTDVEFVGRIEMNNTTTLTIPAHSSCIFVGKNTQGVLAQWSPADDH